MARGPFEMKRWWVEEFFFWLEPVGDRKWTGKDILWVPVDTPSLAKWARGPALIYAGAVTGWWITAAILGFFTPSVIGYWSLIYVVIWTLVTWGLIKMRPEAAIAGFVLANVSLIGGIIEGEYFLSIVLAYAFVHAIRGTFAFQRFAKLETDATSEKKQF